jgi:hypothetical protein
VRTFKWISWNIDKIDAHGLTPEEVESAFNQVFVLERRTDDSYQMYAKTKSRRFIWVIWRFDMVEDSVFDVFGDLIEQPIFVITAY